MPTEIISTIDPPTQIAMSSNVITVGSNLFDPFRDDGGPVLYSSMNRTPAVEDIRNILIYISFSTLFVAFLIIFPGIRKEVSHIFLLTTVAALFDQCRPLSLSLSALLFVHG